MKLRDGVACERRRRELDDSDEPLEVFCVQDADAFGTMIYETLHKETKARGRRRVEPGALASDRDGRRGRNHQGSRAQSCRGLASRPARRYAAYGLVGATCIRFTFAST